MQIKTVNLNFIKYRKVLMIFSQTVRCIELYTRKDDYENQNMTIVSMSLNS